MAASRLVHEGGKDHVACAIPFERSVEGIINPACRCGSCRTYGGAVDKRHVIRVDHVGSSAESRQIGAAHEDGELFAVAAGGVVAENHALDTATADASGLQLLGSIDGLAEGVAPSGVDKDTVIGLCTVGELDGIGDGGVEFDAGHRTCEERDAVRCSDAVSTADGGDANPVGGVGRQTRDEFGGGGGCQSVNRCSAESGNQNVVGRGSACETRLDVPRNHSTCGAGLPNLHVGDSGTEGCILEGDVVDVCIPRSTADGTDGHMCTGAIIGSKARGELFPNSAIADIDRAYLYEGVGIVGVGHHTHLEVGRIGGAAGLCPERELKGVDGMRGNVDGGEHDDLVVAISAGGR